jgi:hypothetical protein
MDRPGTRHPPKTDATGAIGVGVASGHYSKDELLGARAGADYALGSLVEELPGVAEPAG